jgi:DHA2 family multidrug resistance protein
VSAVTASAEPQAPTQHKGLVTAALIMASLMQTLDNTIANVALPHIQGSLSSTQDQMTWVLTSYIIAAAIMTPLSGWLAGQIGRRRVLLFSILGFTVASVLCGLSQSLPEIIGARLLQGACGAALVPMAQAVLLDINPPSQHARAMAAWSMAVTIGPIFGPALGGWLTDHYTWRWVFFINVPVGILCFIGTASFMKETPKRKSRFDFFGFAALAIAIGAFQLTIDRGQTEDWFNSPQIITTACICGVALYLFVIHMLTAKDEPFLSPALFKDRNYMTSNVFIFVVGVVLFATLALLPPLLQDLLNYPVVLTGLVTAPRGVGTLVAMFFVGRFLAKTDYRIIVAAGLAITAVSMWQMSGFYLQMDVSTVVWSGLGQGMGSGLVYVPVASAAFATLPSNLRNEGAAMFSLVRNIGSSMGISLVTTMLTRNTQMFHSRLAEHITPFGDALHSPAAALAPHGNGLAMVNESVTAQAMMMAYNNDFKMMMLLTLGAIPLALLLRKPKNPAAASAEPVVIE